MSPRVDFVIVDATGSDKHWPGALPWRGPSAKRGYATRDEAEARVHAICVDYNAKHGRGLDLRVREREIAARAPRVSGRSISNAERHTTDRLVRLRDDEDAALSEMMIAMGLDRSRVVGALAKSAAKRNRKKSSPA